jgi:hypothetical protein
MIGTYLVSSAILFSLMAVASIAKVDKHTPLQLAVYGPAATFAWLAVARWF